MSESTSEQRSNWAAYECRRDKMISIPFGPDRILVAPPTADAWQALANVLLADGYDIRTSDTDSYNCREIKGGGGRSLHSYGIALDVNWNTNPYKTTPDHRAVVFSNKATQRERAEDVRLGRADTDMTTALIADVLAVRTRNGKRVFEWGGNWTSIKDTMHFEIDVTPEDLATGIDQGTVKKPSGGESFPSTGGGVIVPPDIVIPPDDGAPLSFGSRGPRVSELQSALTAHGFAVGQIDGIFGSNTRFALQSFQTSANLPQTAVADLATLRALGLAPPAPPVPGAPSTDLDQILNLILRVLMAASGKEPAPSTAPPASTPGSIPPDALQKLIEVVLRARMAGPQGAMPMTVPPSAPPQTEGLQKALALLQAIVAPGTDGKSQPLGQVNGALGETVGNLLDGKKTAIGVIGSALTAILAHVPSESGLGQVVAPLIPSAGLSPFAMPVFLAMSAWGVLGKFEKWAQGTAPPPK
jgi:peptidoglycan hydrolase-like protein with peptidoglycan-binding domain